MSERQLVWIDEERCTGCGTCVEICPVGAIALMRDRAHLDEELCTGCHACVDACPQEAIQPMIEGEAVPVPQPQTAMVQAHPAPLRVEAERTPVVAVGLEILSRAAEALARALDRRLAQPSSKSGAVIDDGRSESRGTGGGGGGRRARRRRRGQ
jgi:MinD superfamily P-loop ATPase